MARGSHEARQVNPTLILSVLSLAGFAYAVLSSAVIPALPSFQRSLHTSETGATWLLTAFLVSASVGTAIIGRLGDMYGKEPKSGGLGGGLRDRLRVEVAGGDVELFVVKELDAIVERLRGAIAPG